MDFWKSAIPTINGGPFVIWSGSQHNASPRMYTLSLDLRSTKAYPQVSDLLLLLPISKRGTGILTCFPFGLIIIRLALGSTNPGLIDIAQEPLPIRPMRF